MRYRSYIRALDPALRRKRLRYRFNRRGAGLQATATIARTAVIKFSTCGRRSRVVWQTFRNRAPTSRRTRRRSRDATGANPKNWSLICGKLPHSASFLSIHSIRSHNSACLPRAKSGVKSPHSNPASPQKEPLFLVSSSLIPPNPLAPARCARRVLHWYTPLRSRRRD